MGLTWDYCYFWGKNRDLDICYLQRLDILISFSPNFQTAIPNLSSGIWITVNLLSAVLWYCWHSSKYSSRSYSRRHLQQFTHISVLTNRATSDILNRGSHTAEQTEMWHTENNMAPEKGSVQQLLLLALKRARSSRFRDTSSDSQPHLPHWL